MVGTGRIQRGRVGEGRGEGGRTGKRRNREGAEIKQDGEADKRERETERTVSGATIRKITHLPDRTYSKYLLI